MTKILHTQELTTVECVCGIAYAIPESLYDQAIKHKAQHTLYCPLGHQWHYMGKTDAQKLREAEASIVSMRDQLDAERQAHERTKKRVAKGVCPCCHRSFTQLKRHMTTKHPEFVAAH